MGTIENLEYLIQKYTGPHKTLVESKISRLTAPGENYLGILYRVEAKVKDENTEKVEDFNAVAKCLNFKVHFKAMLPDQYNKEAAFYNEVLPTLNKFLDEIGFEESFDIFPKMYATRKNLKDDNEGEVDEHAVLLMENLHLEGYKNEERTIGFDLDSAKLVLKDVALFHAVPLAFKLKHPDLFQQKIKPHLNRMRFPGNDKNKKENDPAKDAFKIMHQKWLSIFGSNDESKPYVEALSKHFENMQEEFEKKFNTVPSEPFSTISHNDLWTNNTMQIFKGGKAVKNKLVDFQLYSHDSPLMDTVFFLWSSVRLDVIVQHFDDLITIYRDHFLEYLDRLGVDLEPFAGENFQKELDKFAPEEMGHAVFMSIPIYGKKGQAAFDVEKGPEEMTLDAMTDEGEKRSVKIVAEFGKRGWIK